MELFITYKNIGTSKFQNTPHVKVTFTNVFLDNDKTSLLFGHHVVMLFTPYWFVSACVPYLNYGDSGGGYMMDTGLREEAVYHHGRNLSHYGYPLNWIYHVYLWRNTSRNPCSHDNGKTQGEWNWNWSYVGNYW